MALSFSFTKPFKASISFCSIAKSSCLILPSSTCLDRYASESWYLFTSCCKEAMLFPSRDVYPSRICKFWRCFLDSISSLSSSDLDLLKSFDNWAFAMFKLFNESYALLNSSVALFNSWPTCSHNSVLFLSSSFICMISFSNWLLLVICSLNCLICSSSWPCLESSNCSVYLSFCSTAS